MHELHNYFLSHRKFIIASTSVPPAPAPAIARAPSSEPATVRSAQQPCLCSLTLSLCNLSTRTSSSTPEDSKNLMNRPTPTNNVQISLEDMRYPVSWCDSDGRARERYFAYMNGNVHRFWLEYFVKNNPYVIHLLIRILACTNLPLFSCELCVKFVIAVVAWSMTASSLSWTFIAVARNLITPSSPARLRIYSRRIVLIEGWTIRAQNLSHQVASKRQSSERSKALRLDKCRFWKCRYILNKYLMRILSDALASTRIVFHDELSQGSCAAPGYAFVLIEQWEY